MQKYVLNDLINKLVNICAKYYVPIEKLTVIFSGLTVWEISTVTVFASILSIYSGVVDGGAGGRSPPLPPTPKKG